MQLCSPSPTSGVRSASNPRLESHGSCRLYLLAFGCGCCHRKHCKRVCVSDCVCAWFCVTSNALVSVAFCSYFPVCTPQAPTFVCGTWVEAVVEKNNNNKYYNNKKAYLAAAWAAPAVALIVFVWRWRNCFIHACGQLAEWGCHIGWRKQGECVLFQCIFVFIIYFLPHLAPFSVSPSLGVFHCFLTSCLFSCIFFLIFTFNFSKFCRCKMAQAAAASWWPLFEVSFLFLWSVMLLLWFAVTYFRALQHLCYWSSP